MLPQLQLNHLPSKLYSNCTLCCSQLPQDIFAVSHANQISEILHSTGFNLKVLKMDGEIRIYNREKIQVITDDRHDETANSSVAMKYFVSYWTHRGFHRVISRVWIPSIAFSLETFARTRSMRFA